MADLPRLRRIFNHFDPHRLPSDEEYVDLSRARGSAVLEPLLQGLMFASADQPISRLFGGGRGAGKTTELRRFEKELRKAKFVAVYLDVEKTVDINNCDFADFVVAIAMGLQRRLTDDGGARFKIKQYVESKVDEIIGFFGQKVQVPVAKVKGGAKGVDTEVEVRFERTKTAKNTLAGELELLATDATRGVIELISEVVKNVVDDSLEGLVLLVDGGDKILPFRAGEEKDSQHTKIFAKHATQLCSLGCHVVYSVPLSFCYSPDAQSFNATAGAQPIVLPMTSLRDGKQAATQESAGYALFRDMVAKRLETIDEKPSDIFGSSALEEIILNSGGSPTALMTIFQESFVRSDNNLPVRAESVKKALDSISNAMGRQIAPSYWPILQEYKAPNGVSNRTAEFMECLYYQYLYEYMNGASWFEVNPVLRRLPQLAG